MPFYARGHLVRRLKYYLVPDSRRLHPETAQPSFLGGLDTVYSIW